MLVFCTNLLLLVPLEVSWDDFDFFPKIRRDIRQKVGSAVYETPRNGDKSVNRGAQLLSITIAVKGMNLVSVTYLFKN